MLKKKQPTPKKQVSDFRGLFHIDKKCQGWKSNYKNIILSPTDLLQWRKSKLYLIGIEMIEIDDRSFQKKKLSKLNLTDANI